MRESGFGHSLIHHITMTTKRRYFAAGMTAMLLAAAAFSSCGDSRATQEQISAASDTGRQRALEFSPEAIGTDTAAMTIMLLDVRERETRLRSNGHDKAADAYINAFLSTLDSVNPSLATEIR